MSLACIHGGECTGCMGCEHENSYICPVCGEPLAYDDTVYKDGHGSVIGCRFCVTTAYAEDEC